TTFEERDEVLDRRDAAVLDDKVLVCGDDGIGRQGNRAGQAELISLERLAVLEPVGVELHPDEIALEPFSDAGVWKHIGFHLAAVGARVAGEIDEYGLAFLTGFKEG